MKKIVIAVATLIHLLPHAFGVSSVGALALYGGAFGKPRTSWLVPMLPLALGLLVTGLYVPVVLAFVFAGYALSTLAGRWFLRQARSLGRFGLAVGTGALIFYAVSNFAMWLVGYYPPTLAGLVQCYVNGLPFLGVAALADAAYSFVLFGLHAWLARRETAPVHA